MRADWLAFERYARADDPCRRPEKATRPRRTTEDQLGRDVNRPDECEEQQQSRDPGCGASVQANSLSGPD